MEPEWSPGSQGEALMEQAFENQDLIEKLGESSFFLDYQKAFTSATGMDLSLAPAMGSQLEIWESHQKHEESCRTRFCARMIENRESCAQCMEFEYQLLKKAQKAPVTEICPFGASESALPIKISDEVVGYLKTGRVMVGELKMEQIAGLARKLRTLGLGSHVSGALKDMTSAPMVEKSQYDAALQILEFFSQQLSTQAEQLASRMETGAPGFILRAKQYIHEKIGEDISLREVARKVNTSSYYLCKQFKKSTGLSYTEYVSRIRIHKAKRLLKSPEVRVSEVAFQVGFQSLTHFNRVFKKFTGHSPTEFRSLTEMAA